MSQERRQREHAAVWRLWPRSSHLLRSPKAEGTPFCFQMFPQHLKSFWIAKYHKYVTFCFLGCSQWRLVLPRVPSQTTLSPHKFSSALLHRLWGGTGRRGVWGRGRRIWGWGRGRVGRWGFRGGRERKVGRFGWIVSQPGCILMYFVLLLKQIYHE